MRFILNKDKVTLEGYFDTNVSGTIKYYEIPIEYDETWENLVIKAIIVNKDEDTGEEISVINNKFFIDKKKSGTYRVGFVGYTIENEQKVYQVSTDLVSFIIDKGAGEIEGVESHDIPTPSEWEVYIAQIQNMIDGLEEQIPTKLSQLQNDNHTVQDEDYVHTDNNFSNEDKTKLDSLENYDDTEIKDDIQEINGDIDEINTNLLNYSLITETGSKIDLEINSSTYELVAKLYNKNNNLISTSRKIDLPIESMVVSGSYDSVNKKIVLILDNGNTIDIPVGDLISGLQTEITSTNKLESDLVDDTNQNNKFVTTQEKETWNEKYYKPNGGIPKTDLSSEVQASLDKADTAIQESDLEASQAIQDEKITAIEKQIPTGEVNDTSITLTDSADYWVKEFGIEGNTEQETRSGKNLFNINGDVNTRYDGTTNTNNTVSGNDLTTTTNAGSTNPYGQKIYVGTGNTVTFSAKLKSVTYDTTPTPTTTVAYMTLYNENTTTERQTNSFNYANIGTKKSVSIIALTDYIYATFGRASNDTSTTFTDIQVEIGSTATDYEPYGASPSPEYPSPVNTITGDVEVKVQNKNLFDVESWVSKGNNSNYYSYSNGVLSINALDSRSYGNFVEAEKIFLPNGTYYLSNIGNAGIRIYRSTVATDYVTTNEFTVINGYIYLKLVSSTVMTCQPQIEKGTTASSYIEHQEQNYPISLGDIELCKIGEYQDYIYKENGNWYKYGAIGKHIFDGTENWSLNAERTTSDGRTYLQFVVSKNILTNPKLNANIVCNYFRQSNATAYGFNNVYIGYSNFNICIDKNVVTSLAEFKTWLSTHNVTVYYVLEPPVITQIED